MKKYNGIVIFVLTLMSSALADSDVEIQQGVTYLGESGYTTPAHQYQIKCSVIGKEIHLETRRGINSSGHWIRVRHYHFHASKFSQTTMADLIRVASTGKIQDGGAICDAGSSVLVGYYQSKPFDISAIRDCASIRINDSLATVPLIQLTERLCRIKIPDLP